MKEDIDEPSFMLGKLTGKLDQMDRTQKAMFEKLDNIERSVTHIKVKNASQAATIAVVLSLIVAFFKDLFGSYFYRCWFGIPFYWWFLDCFFHGYFYFCQLYNYLYIYCW